MSEELIQVTEIVVTVGSRKISLTPEEARRMRDALDELLGPRNHHVPVYTPLIQPPRYEQPIWVNPNAEPWSGYWSVSYGPLLQSCTISINANNLGNG